MPLSHKCFSVVRFVTFGFLSLYSSVFMFCLLQPTVHLQLAKLSSVQIDLIQTFYPTAERQEDGLELSVCDNEQLVVMLSSPF